MSLLGELVELFNHRFGEHLTDADAIHPAQALKEPFVIDGALDAGKVSADFFRGVLDDEDFRQRTTFLAMRVLYDRYRSDQDSASA